jgi:hypothetical protein
MIWRTRQFCFLIDQNRIVVTETTQDFVGNWTSGEDSFQVDPPNAALVVFTDIKNMMFSRLNYLIRHTMRMKNAIRYDFSVLGYAYIVP